jgi:glycosidase
MDSQQLKTQTIYQIYVRNHTKAGTFQALIKDLPRIAKLGAKIIYLLPIHPIGVTARKGTLGSPYSIQDYYAINPELGTLDDVQAFLKQAHQLGFKVMMDIVFNHTSRDAVWVKTHPEFYYYKDGQLANRIGDWSDIADLDLEQMKVQDALIEVLKYWTQFGFDAYRCDVAPIIPLSFWLRAKEEVAKINPQVFWLSESVHPSFIQYLRGNGFRAHADAEMYQAFDALYDYDVFEFLKDYLYKRGDLKTYLTMVNTQSYMYPGDYVKAHFLENHDVERIAKVVTNPLILRNLTAWSFFQHGMGFIYAGQEYMANQLPSLFEKDTIQLGNDQHSMFQFIQALIAVKANPLFAQARTFKIIDKPLHRDMIEATLIAPAGQLHGIFNITKETRKVYVSIADGTYLDLISHQHIIIHQGMVDINEPLILVTSST